MRISLSITHLLSIRIGHLRTPIVQCLTGHGKFQEYFSYAEDDARRRVQLMQRGQNSLYELFHCSGHIP